MIGIIAAMKTELDAVIAEMEEVENVTLSGISMVKGTLNKKPVVVMLSGVGKGNAAMSTTILLEHFHLHAVVNVGTAGGLKQEQEILDAVVSERVVQHDFDTSPVDGEEGYGLYFDADHDLIDLCMIALRKLDVCTHRGLIASGDQFVAEKEQLERLYTLYPNAVCAEMEAGAIAQVCTHYKVPFVVLRSLSDVAPKEDSHMDFLTYAKHASARSASFCKEFVTLLA